MILPFMQNCAIIFLSNKLYSEKVNNMKAINIIRKILKGIMLFLAAIWGIGCGILFPAVILLVGADIVPADIANSPVIIVWLITSIIGYVIPSILVMCKLCKTASILSLGGFIGTLFVYSGFAELYKYTEESSGPAELYMPCMFITLIIIATTILENTDKIKAMLDGKREKENARAPSIFGSDNDK